MKKIRLTDNLALRILAVFVAFLIWLIVVNVSDPITTISYSGVAVEVLNPEVITAQNETYEILEDTDTISVSVTAKRSINDLLVKENLKATADMKDLNAEKGRIRIRVESNKYSDKIESIKTKTEYLEVNIEQLQKKQFTITPVVNGDPVEGYVIGDINLDQNVVTVQGPESVVSRIDHATAEVSVSGMSGSISTTSTIRYYDLNGEQLSAARLTSNISSVGVKVELLATKMISLDFSVSGELAEGYGLTGSVKPDVEEVLVAGKASNLANLNTISIPDTAISAEGKSETFHTEVDIRKYLPDTIKLADETFDGKVNVKVGVGKLEKTTLQVPKSNLEVVGLDEEYQKCTVIGNESTIEIEVIGLVADLEKLSGDDITGTIDVDSFMEKRSLASVKEGVYDLPVTLELPKRISPSESDFTVECRISDIKK